MAEDEGNAKKVEKGDEQLRHTAEKRLIDE